MQLPDIKSVDDLFALAVALERRAADRFHRLAARMRTADRDDLAALFERLAGEEEAHEAALVTVAMEKDLEIRAADASQLEMLGEASPLPEVADLARASVYDCLADAVRNEERAFAFFSHLAAHADDPVLQAEAEALAKEELAHAHLLRQARRAAYRERPAASDRWPDPGSIQDLADLDRAAARGEAEIARQLAEIADHLPDGAALSAAAARMSASLGGSPVEIRDADAEDADAVPTTDQERLGIVVDAAEDAFAFYDSVATTAAREDVLLRAQELTTHAVARLRSLRIAAD